MFCMNCKYMILYVFDKRNKAYIYIINLYKMFKGGLLGPADALIALIAA